MKRHSSMCHLLLVTYFHLIFLISYGNSEEGIIKMHRSVSSDDVVEYPTNIPARDVELVEEEDIEYRDGKLFKSNGTMNVSIEKALSSQDEFTPDSADENQDDNFSNMFNARGSYAMELKVCRLVPLTARGRRNAVRKHFNRHSTAEESLMASFDQGLFRVGITELCVKLKL